MLRIDTECSRCQRSVQITEDDLVLWICANHKASSYFTYDCPVCGYEARSSASFEMVELYRKRLWHDIWTVPPEFAEPKLGAVLTEDDLITFGLLLEAS